MQQKTSFSYRFISFLSNWIWYFILFFFAPSMNRRQNREFCFSGFFGNTLTHGYNSRDKAKSQSGANFSRINDKCTSVICFLLFYHKLSLIIFMSCASRNECVQKINTMQWKKTSRGREVKENVESWWFSYIELTWPGTAVYLTALCATWAFL